MVTQLQPNRKYNADSNDGFTITYYNLSDKQTWPVIPQVLQ